MGVSLAEHCEIVGGWFIRISLLHPITISPNIWGNYQPTGVLSTAQMSNAKNSNSCDDSHSRGVNQLPNPTDPAWEGISMNDSQSEKTLRFTNRCFLKTHCHHHWVSQNCTSREVWVFATPWVAFKGTVTGPSPRAHGRQPGQPGHIHRGPGLRLAEVGTMKIWGGS